MATDDADDLVPFQEVRVKVDVPSPALPDRGEERLAASWLRVDDLGCRTVWVRRSDAFGRRCGDDAVPSP